MRETATDITVVLDRSGSMRTRQADAIGGFNSLVEDQRKQDGEAKLSLIQFDDVYEPNYAGVDLKHATLLSTENYMPRGSTALLDAIGRTINETGARLRGMSESHRPGKIIFVIITDGEENASTQFTKRQINQMISHQRDNYNWQFVFIGTNQDAIAEARAIGILAMSALQYSNTIGGTKAMYNSASNLISRARTSSVENLASSASFTKDERDASSEI